MLFNNVVGDRETKACTRLLVCDECIKNFRQNGRVYAWAGIFHSEENFILRNQALGSNCEAAAGFHYFDCIDK